MFVYNFCWQRQLINYASEWKSSDRYPPPLMKILKWFYVVALHPIFEWTIFAIIVFNMLCSILELSINNSKALMVLDIFNYYFCAAYVIEAMLKVCSMNKVTIVTELILKIILYNYITTAICTCCDG